MEALWLRLMMVPPVRSDITIKGSRKALTAMASQSTFHRVLGVWRLVLSLGGRRREKALDRSLQRESLRRM